MVASTKLTNGSKPKPVERGQVLRRYFVIKVKDKVNRYLSDNIWASTKAKQPDDERYVVLYKAARFLAVENADHFAHRVLGEGTYEVVEAELPTTRDDGAFCRLTPK